VAADIEMETLISHVRKYRRRKQGRLQDQRRPPPLLRGDSPPSDLPARPPMMATFVFMFYYATQVPRVKSRRTNPVPHNPAALSNATAAMPNARTNTGSVRKLTQKIHRNASTIKACTANS